ADSCAGECPSGSTLCPYTTLFRSKEASAETGRAAVDARHASRTWPGETSRRSASSSAVGGRPRSVESSSVTAATCTVRSFTRRRSEEHTSELQSRENLVCRLLLEK